MNKTWKLSIIDSKIFSAMKTIAMFMVLIIHSDLRNHGAEQNLLSDLYNEFFSLILADGAVPVFFFISGFFFFKNYSYKDKLKSRVHTIFIPFVLWCLWGVCILYILQIILGLDYLFTGKNMKLLADWKLLDYTKIFWNIRDGAPVISTLWFLRDLCLMVFISPLINRLIKFRGGGCVVLLLFILYFGGITNPLIKFGSLFFFSLGGLISTKGYNIFVFFEKYSNVIILCSLVSILMTVIFYCVSSDIYLYIKRLWIVATIPMLYFCCKNPKVYSSRILLYLSEFSFFIYLFHEPLMGYIQKMFYNFFVVPVWMQYVLFWCFPLVTLCISIIVYKVLKRCTPKFLYIIIGKH